MRTEELDRLALQHVVTPGVAPASVVAAASRTAEQWIITTGVAGTRSVTTPEPVCEETPFDLASVTKPVVASAVARLVARGLLSWDVPVGDVVTELRGTRSASLPLIAFLSHRAGLEAHLGLFLPLAEGRPVDAMGALLVAADARRGDCEGPFPPGGFPPVYSDMGYYLLGVVASRASGLELGPLVAREVAHPLQLALGSAAEWRARPVGFLDSVARTEDVPWRGGEITGAVHDENAWALTGLGLAGHAGLFGTAAAVARFGAAMVDALAGRGDWLPRDVASALVAPRPGGTLRAGFDGRSEEGSSAGTLFGPRSFGHLGFTGTSLWCDPDTDIVTVILTNRVNPTRDNVAIRAARPPLNDALYRAALSEGTRATRKN